MNRREFLGALGAGSAALAWGGLPVEALAAAGKGSRHDYPVTVTGEDSRVGHMLRDGHVFQLPAPSRKVDVVVVGAGICGLTAAYNLQGAEVLLLEKEARPGGHARKDSWRGLDFAQGAAYVADTSGYLGELIEALDIPLVEIEDPGDAYHVGGHTVTEFWEGKGLPLGRSAQREFQRFFADMKAIKDIPPLPVERATASQLKTDLRSFGALAKPYGPEVHRYLDLFSRSALGGPVDQVSAYWGLSFFSDFFAPAFTAPGGTAAFGEALVKAVGTQRIVTGATVIKVAQAGDRVRVSYVVGDEVTTVEARAVVMATPKHITRRVLAGLPKAQDAAMGAMRYEPYLVTNVLVNGPVAREAYDTWTPGAPFTDVVVADWVDRRTPDRPQAVLTAYCPQAYGDRWRLLDDDYARAQGLAVVAHLDRMHPGLAGRVSEVRVFKWGHPMVLAAVGAITQLRPQVIRPVGSVFISGGDCQMSATIEGAVHEGRRAALAVKPLLRRVGAP